LSAALAMAIVIEMSVVPITTTMTTAVEIVIVSDESSFSPEGIKQI